MMKLLVKQVYSIYW